MNKIARRVLLKQAMNKRSADLGSALYLAGLAAFIGTFGTGALAGYGTAKLTEPGAYDNQNLEKEYLLQRIKRDNKVQEAQLDRQTVQRAMRDKKTKPIRVF